MAAQVEVAIFHAEVIASVGLVFDGERRHFGAVQHVHFSDCYLYIAGGDIRIFAGALHDGARGTDHPLTSQVFGAVA